MEKYLVYITPSLTPEGKISVQITKSKLENSIYCIEGYKPRLMEVLLTKGIPKRERCFYGLVQKEFEEKILISDKEVEEFCKKYNFIFEKLNFCKKYNFIFEKLRDS